jgi:hypothetical protein
MHRRQLLALAALLPAALSPAAAWAGEDKDKKKKSGGVSYIPIDTLTGATNRGGGRRGVMSVECGIDVPDNALRERANASLPRLRAAFLQTVLIYAGGLPVGSAPNADFLARTMQNETDTVLGKPGARFLIGAILVN